MNKYLFLLLLTIGSIKNVHAQNKIAGIVTTSSGEVLPGVTVLIKNTSTGTITNFDGEFSLNISDKNALIVFSYVGMISKEITYTGQDNIKVFLKEQANNLDEVVVIGYGAVKKKDLTGSVGSIKASVIAENKTPNLFDALQGRLSGVNITSESGAPGSGVNINIRGANSISGAGSPLFVIDGVQIDISEDEVAGSTMGSPSTMGPLSTINPQDIESIEVLKDASATAIYGSRGANGVIIITTKGGENGIATFEYTTSVGVSNANKRIDIIDPQTYIDYRNTREQNSNFTNIDTDGDGIPDTPRDFTNIANYDWQKEALRPAFTTNHMISATGGSKKSNYAAGVAFLNQEGIVKDNDYIKYSFRIKANHQQTEKLKFGFSLNSAFSELDGVANSGGADSYNGVVQYLVISNPWELPDQTLEDGASDQYISPMTLIEEGEKTTRLSRTRSSVYGEYKLSKSFRFRSLFGASVSNSKLKEFYNSQTSYGNRWEGRAVINQVESYSYNFSNVLTFNKKFKKKHYVNFIAGFEMAHYNFEKFLNDITNFEDESTGYNDISKGSVIKNYQSQRDVSNRMSYLSRLNYIYKGKYLFTASFRADGSDKFGENNRWGYFPGAAFAWRVNKEQFLKNITEISNLKLRVSYGKTGNERIPAYSYAAKMENTYYASNNITYFGMSPGSSANPNLKWETTTQYDAGIDIGLFQNRITITFDYYNKQTHDMLLNAPVPGQSGNSSQWINFGRVDNTGVEFSLSTVNIQVPNFSWKTDFNISKNNNTVKNIGGAEYIPVTMPGGWIQNPGRVIVGQPIGLMYGYVFDGIHQSGNTEGITPGSMRYKDLNGDGEIDDANDRTTIGNSNPKHIGGLSNSLTYKNINLSFLFQWSYGNDVFNAGTLRTNGLQPFMNVTKDYYQNAWTEENASNIAPAIGKVETVASSYFVEDASYLRLKNINVSYRFPEKLFLNSQISGIHLFASANNLITWSNYSGFDPEVSSFNPLIRGFERFSYPRSRTITLGVNLKF